MVGVANSVGCVTCRSRKVKCDLQRPSCAKCIKAGRDCGGYKRDRVFIIGTQEDRGRCSSHPKRGPLIPRSNKRPHPTSPTPSQSSNSNTVISDTSSSSNDSRETAIRRRISSVSPHPLVQSAHVNLRQFIVQNMDDFLMKPLFETSPRSRVPSLLHYLPEMAGRSKLFNRGILAFCLLAAGKRNNDDRLNKASLKMSVDAMSEMQTTILSPTQSQKTEVIASTILLSDCEIMLREAYDSTNQYYNWQGLLRGTSALIYERGPHSFSQYPDYQLFTRGFRGNGILEAIGRRQHTFLASREWITIPWSKGIEKDPTDYLFDIMAMLAGYLADVDKIIGLRVHDSISEDPCEENPKYLLKKLFGLADTLAIWEADLQSESENLFTIISTTTDSKGYSTQQPAIFPFIYKFPNFRLGILHMYNWASLILIYEAISKLQLFIEFQSSILSISPNAENINTKTIREFSRNICQSVDSLIETALMESWSVVHMLVFPLWIVIQCYRERSEMESGFLNGVLRRLVGCDISFAENLCNMSFEDYARM